MMAPTHGQDEQSRDRWPLNESPGLTADDPRLASRAAASQEAGARDGAGSSDAGETRVLEKQAVRSDAAEGSRLPGDVDFATYVDDMLRLRRASGGPEAEAARADADERGMFERVGYGGLYRSGEVPTDTSGRQYDDSVLGLNYSTVTPRTPVSDERWASALRSFARSAVWSMPFGVLLLALSGFFGAPTATTEPAVVSPGVWVVITTLGLGLWLIGVVALAALVANTRVRPWGYVAVVASALGLALLAPAIGITGLARPAITRTARQAPDDGRIAGLASEMQSRLLDNGPGRWLVIGGTVLLIIGGLAVVGTILSSRALQRHDGWLVMSGLAIAVIAALLSWEFLFVLAAMVVLAGALGLAYTVSRLTPDGSPPRSY
jgi:hypothetical protein